MALEIFRLIGSVFVDTKDAEKSLKKTDKNAEGFGSKLLAVGKTAGKFALSVGAAAVTAGGAIVALTESTRDYRTEQGKLQAAFQTQNFTADQARETYEALNGVLGDSGQAVEAANHLAMLCDTEKELSQWTDIATGVYATFGDSLPIEGLTEAANETARCGQLTGGLTDAINWAAKEGETFGVTLKENTWANREWNEAVKACTSAEDYFNLALQQCSTEQERAALITKTMNGLYSEAADKYKELNADVIAANEAQDKLNNAMAKVGGAMEPFVTKGKALLADVMVELVPILEWAASTILPLFGNAISVVVDWVNLLLPILERVASRVMPWVSSAIQLVVDWFGQMANKVSDTGLTFDSAMGLIKKAFSFAMTHINDYWVLYGQPVWEFIKMTVGLVADYFKERMPQIQEFVRTCFTDIETIWNENLKPAMKALGDFITNVLAPAFKWVFQNVITPVADAAFRGISLLWSGTLKPVLEGMCDFISGVFSGNFTKAFEGVVKAVGGVWEGIKTVIKVPINAAIGLINKFIGSINGIKIPDWVPGMGGTGILNIPQIPLLYDGGVLERGQVGLLEGTGAEAVVPLENNKRWTRAVAKDMSDAMGGGNTEALLNELIDLQRRTIRLLAAGQTIVLNEREVARTVRSYA